MNMRLARQMLLTEKEGRAQPRFTVALPALRWLEGTRFSISLINIAADGAMIEAAADLSLGTRLTVGCGSINVMAKVVWLSPDRRYGVRFEHTLKQREVDEQISRSEALSARRDKRAVVKLGLDPLSWMQM